MSRLGIDSQHLSQMTAQVEADRGNDLRMNLHTPKLLADDKQCVILVGGIPPSR